MSKSKYPRIHLAVDNCFAIKRWVEPRDWMRVIKGLGDISLIQASTDNEIDPAHNTKEYCDEWVNEVKKYEKEYGLKVVSLYSGYATYRTVGIASLCESKRQTMIDRYYKPVVDIAQKLEAQVGNSIGAISEPVLQDPSLFAETEKHLENSLCQMSEYAAGHGVTFGYEQMYTPTQSMWTIAECEKRMRSIYARTGCPMYITIDTAHQAGQLFYLKPTLSNIREMLSTGDTGRYRLPDAIKYGIKSAKRADELYEELSKYEYWFAQPKDADVFEWFSSLGCYSPLVHLQQTDGTYSSHKPFTAQYNNTGIIKPRDVFEAIAISYDDNEKEGMPPRVSDIYLAFEVFFNITDSTDKIIRDMKDSIAFWRKYLPCDGMTLDELLGCST